MDPGGGAAAAAAAGTSTTNTLADALLDDLDDLSDVGEEEEEQRPQEAEEGRQQQQQQRERDGSSAAAAAADDERSERKKPPPSGNAANEGAAASSSLLHDAALLRHLEEIRKHEGTDGDGAAGAVRRSGDAADDDDEVDEHGLIVKSNKHLARLSTELMRAHDELCTAFKPKFPELEEILPSPLQYVRAVKAILSATAAATARGGEVDVSDPAIASQLEQFLTSNQILTLGVSASTTSGRLLTEVELDQVNTAIKKIENVQRIREELTNYVQQRMHKLAPNICALVGNSGVAATLLGLAGGLEEMSKIPACNLQVLGQTKQTSTSRGGLSTSQTRPNEGILAECDLVRRCPKHLQKKALKTVAAKLALAARCDYALSQTAKQQSASARGSSNNDNADNDEASKSGRSFRTEIEAKIEKWLEPDKAPVLKALPKPDLTIKRRRGGRRIRRMKEKFEETALMKQANTRAFSTQTGEYGDDAMGLTMGLLDTADVSGGGAGALRKRTEKRKMKYANTKASRKRAAQLQAQAASATSSSASGLASSMAFTPVQGMELVNPDARRERVEEANRKWFSDNAGFKSALPKK